MRYKLRPLEGNGTVLVVGCGGTGGFVAEGLCRLLIGSDHRIILVDNDRVEKRNLSRQNFYPADLGRFKAQVLAERLAAQFNRSIEYTAEDIRHLGLGYRGDLTIGCVDNPSTRARLQYAGVKGMGMTKFSYCEYGGWYIDAGNGEHSGQVLIGNALTRELHAPFNPSTGICSRLPLPQLQQPALLAPESRPRRRRHCAEAVARDEQSPVINRIMADLVLTFVLKLMKGTLSWMGAYVDLEAGSLSFIDAEPATVSRITGQTIRQLEYHPRKER